MTFNTHSKLRKLLDVYSVCLCSFYYFYVAYFSRVHFSVFAQWFVYINKDKICVMHKLSFSHNGVNSHPQNKLYSTTDYTYLSKGK